MKRTGLVIPIVVLALALLIALAFLFRGKVDPLAYGKIGMDFIGALLQLVELVGIILICVLVIGVLVRRYLLFQPYRFVFKGFHDASIFRSTEQKSIDLDLLAREEFSRLITLMEYNWKEDGDYKPLSIDALISYLSHVDTYFARQGEEVFLRHTPAKFLPSDKSVGGTAALIQATQLRTYIAVRKVFKDFPNLEDTADLMSKIADFAPEQISSIMKLINKIIPPPTIEFTGHLLWHCRTQEDYTGITFEIVGPGKQRNLMHPPFGVKVCKIKSLLNVHMSLGLFLLIQALETVLFRNGIHLQSKQR